jgi:hypothetical protein
MEWTTEESVRGYVDKMIILNLVVKKYHTMLCAAITWLETASSGGLREDYNNPPVLTNCVSGQLLKGGSTALTSLNIVVCYVWPPLRGFR